MVPFGISLRTAGCPARSSSTTNVTISGCCCTRADRLASPLDFDNLLAGQGGWPLAQKKGAGRDRCVPHGWRTTVDGSLPTVPVVRRACLRTRRDPSALKLGVTVRTEMLPEDVRELVLYQKQSVTHEQFRRDIARLVEAFKFACRIASKSSCWPHVCVRQARSDCL